MTPNTVHPSIVGNIRFKRILYYVRISDFHSISTQNIYISYTNLSPFCDNMCNYYGLLYIFSLWNSLVNIDYVILNTSKLILDIELNESFHSFEAQFELLSHVEFYLF